MVVRVAVASSDGKVVNQHFGHAQQFMIFDLDKNGNFEFVETRKNEPSCSGGDHTSDALECTLDVIKDSKFVLVSQIGPGASQFLISKGIQPIMIPLFITDALEKLKKEIIFNDI